MNIRQKEKFAVATVIVNLAEKALEHYSAEHQDQTYILPLEVKKNIYLKDNRCFPLQMEITRKLSEVLKTKNYRVVKNAEQAHYFLQTTTVKLKNLISENNESPRFFKKLKKLSNDQDLNPITYLIISKLSMSFRASNKIIKPLHLPYKLLLTKRIGTTQVILDLSPQNQELV